MREKSCENCETLDSNVSMVSTNSADRPDKNYHLQGYFKPIKQEPKLDDEVENLASRFHKVYEEELKRQGKKSKYDEFYFKLPEDIKDLDRALAKYVLEFRKPIWRKEWEEENGK